MIVRGDVRFVPNCAFGPAPRVKNLPSFALGDLLETDEPGSSVDVFFPMREAHAECVKYPQDPGNPESRA